MCELYLSRFRSSNILSLSKNSCHGIRFILTALPLRTILHQVSLIRFYLMTFRPFHKFFVYLVDLKALGRPLAERVRKYSHLCSRNALENEDAIRIATARFIFEKHKQDAPFDWISERVIAVDKPENELIIVSRRNECLLIRFSVRKII